jgi:hypothetical protein
MSISVVIFSRGAGAQQYGLGQDAKLMELTLRELAATGKSRMLVKHSDPYTYVGKEKPSYADIHIYLEVPCRVAFPWAKENVVIPNPEWWFKDEWAWVREDPSVTFLHKSQHSLNLFGAGHYIGWRCPDYNFKKRAFTEKTDQYLYVVGGSKNKLAALEKIVESWSSELKPLIVVSQIKTDVVCDKPNIVWKTEYLHKDELRELQEISKYHIVASTCEGFGYTMAEALSAGANVVWTSIPVYKELWQELLGTAGSIECERVVDLSGSTLDGPSSFTTESVINGIKTSGEQNPSLAAAYIMKMNKAFRSAFYTEWSKITWRLRTKKQVFLKVPPVIPVLGVVTLVKNRPGWFMNAVRNIETADYPRDKLVWVIVDDGDFDKRVDSYIDKVKKQLPDLKVAYVSMTRAIHIGEKRNRGIKQAIVERPDLELIAFMDDDDHYPVGSLISRVAWLESYKCDVVYCSTLPMYDTTHYISAVNVPPLDLAPRKRVSEATLCFRRSFWEEKGFPSKISVAEAEEFLVGRENKTIEVPPNGIIVSFLHGKNFTSRRVPDSTVPNGCHYGFTDEYFTMISQLGNADA